MISKPHIDPEYERWRRKYPKFPGVETCVELLKKTNVQGAWIDIICAELEEHAKQNPADLIAAIREPENNDVRLILLGALENATVSDAVPLFAKILEGDNENERSYAIHGLKSVNTKEARTVLWNAGVRP